MPLDVVVAGAGIGGCTAAVALKRAGHRVRVFEAVPELAPLGLGINLQPSGALFLHELGLGGMLEGIGVRTRQLKYYTPQGEEVIADPRGMYAGYAVPQYSIHRGKLHMALLDAARRHADEVACGWRLAGWDDAGARARVRFARTGPDGRALERGGEEREVGCDVLIAADGIHSAARRLLHPQEDPRPRYSGLMLWRGATEMDPFQGGDTMFMAGTNDAKLVVYPICAETARRGRSLVNWIAETWRRDIDDWGWNRLGNVADFQPVFESWGGGFAPGGFLDIQKMFGGAEKVWEFPMIDRDPLPKWSFGRVTLLGDAAHAMRPNGSNGATQAILDARSLAEELGEAGGVPRALQRYEEARREKANRIIHANRLTGPERVLQMHADDPECPQWALDSVIAKYRKLAGFDKVSVNEAFAAWRRREGDAAGAAAAAVGAARAAEAARGFRPFNQRAHDARLGLTELKLRADGTFALLQVPPGGAAGTLHAGHYSAAGGGALQFAAFSVAPAGRHGPAAPCRAEFRGECAGSDADDFVVTLDGAAPPPAAGRRLVCLGAKGSSLNLGLVEYERGGGSETRAPTAKL